MEKKNDKELLEDVLNVYFGSKSKKDFNEKLKNYISDNKIKKSPEYLKSLLEEYKERVLKGTPEYEMICKTKEIHKVNGNPKTIVNQLMRMTEEELKKYLEGKRLSEIKLKIGKYSESITDKSDLELVDKLLTRIIEIKETTMTTKKNQENQQRYERAIEIFDTMTKRGFFSFCEFNRKMHDHFNCNLDEMERQTSKSRVLLNEKYPEKYEEYKNKIKKNKIRFYILHQRQIRDMLIAIKHEKYDIVDYYINFRIPSKVFINLYKDFHEMKIIKTESRTLLNKFFEKYLAHPYSDTLNWNCTNLSECNGEITQSEHDKLVEFMSYYGIPKCYFKLCFKKYKKGELNYFFGRQLKKIS